MKQDSAREKYISAGVVQPGDEVLITKENDESDVRLGVRLDPHRKLGKTGVANRFDPYDGGWMVDFGDRSTWVHEDCLEPYRASEREVAQAIASITGQPVPPSRPNLEDPTVAFLQGYTVMGLTKDWKDGKLPLKVADVEQLTGPDGTYLNHCTVVTESGKRIRITFEEDA